MKEVSIEINHDCALKCIFCSSSADHPSPSGELNFDTIKNIIDDAVACEAAVVSLSGGEPLLYKDIFSIMEYCRQLNLKVALYTSGVLFSGNEHRIPVDFHIWEKIHNLLGDYFTAIFDFQSCNAKNAELLYDVEDSFPIVIKSIKNAISKNIQCEIHFVPLKPNYKEIPDVLKFCKDIGIKKVSFLRFVPQGRGAENVDKLDLNTEEFFELQQILYEAINTYGSDYIRLGHPIDFLFCIDRKCEITSCRGGSDAPLILPDGSVHMCPAWKDIKSLQAGNIFDKNLKDIWETSNFYVEFRKLIEQPSLIEGLCRTCSLLPQCKGGCTAQRILLFKRLNIPFPKAMYLSPDPVCPLINNYTLKNKIQLNNDNRSE